MRLIRSKSAAAALVVAAALLALPTAGGAVSAIEGTILVSFDGKISPSKLPRGESVPVGVQMGGKVRTTDRSTPPKLDRIILDINRNGILRAKGLPTCSLGRLRSLSSGDALRACGGARVGSGSVTSQLTLPGRSASSSHGRLLAFNGRYKGSQAIFAQVASGAPLPLTYVIVFEVRRTSGTYGTSLVGTLPPIASEYGYISDFDLLLQRQYSLHGKSMSYASASCPAPEGFTAANFAFARVSYEFADGVDLSIKLVRQCKVRR